MKNPQKFSPINEKTEEHDAQNRQSNRPGLSHHIIQRGTRRRQTFFSDPEDWPWSSAAAHIKRENDRFVNVTPLLQMINGDWGDFLSSARAEKDTELLKKHERTGRPLGGEKFIDRLELTLGMSLKPQKPGRKPKDSK